MNNVVTGRNKGGCPEEQGHIVVVGQGRGKVYPRAEFPLCPNTPGRVPVRSGALLSPLPSSTLYQKS